MAQMLLKRANTLKDAQRKYKKYFEAGIKAKPMFVPDQKVYGNRPPLMTSSSVRLTNQGYSKLWPRMHEPWTVLDVQSHAFISEGNGVAITASDGSATSLKKDAIAKSTNDEHAGKEVTDEQGSNGDNRYINNK